MADAPTLVRVRSYNMGFGDGFLLTYTYASGKAANVLIDLGSTKQSSTGPRGGMLQIAEQIREDCGGKLQMLVATHRHADHISGFGGEPGKVIAALEPDVVVQPWTEQPDLDPEAKGPDGAGDGKGMAARAAAARLSAMQAMAAAALDQLPRLRAAAGVPKTVTDQIQFLGETNLKNADAVRNLATMGKKHVYAHFGTKLALGRILPGVKVEVLGPPTLEQSSAITSQRATDEEEFWQLAARGLAAAAKAKPGAAVFPRAPKVRRVPQEARWVIPRIDKMRGEEILAIVRSLDDVLNNTSVILLFEIGDTRLLFPGDAQIENWNYALRECDEAEKIRKRLADVAFYKVGHHGSLNATPKTLWSGFEHRGPADTPSRLTTMVSTAAGKHGSVARGTEVPRRVLIEELTRASDLYNTQSLKSRDVFWNDAEIKL